MRLLLLLIFTGITGLIAQSDEQAWRETATNADLPDSTRFQALDGLGTTYRLGLIDSTLKYARLYKELASNSRIASAPGKALLLFSLYHTQKGDSALARQLLEEGTEICVAEGEAEYAAIRIRDVAKYYMNREIYPAARPYWQYGAKIGEAAGNLRWWGIHTANTGLTYEREGESKLAISHYEKSVALFKESGDSTLEAWSLDGLGRVFHLILRENEKALGYYQRAFEIRKASGNDLTAAGTKVNMAGVYMGQGDYAKGLPEYQEALSTVVNGERQDAVAKGFQAVILSNIGEIYSRQEAYTIALDYFEQGLEVARESKVKRHIARLLYSTAASQNQLGEDSLAFTYAEEGLALARETGIKMLEAQTLDVLGGIYQARGEIQRAKETYQASLALSVELEGKWEQTEALFSLASLSRAEGANGKAIDYAKKGLLIAQETEAIGQVARITDVLWQSQQALGQHEAALQSYQLHIEARDSINREENQRATFEFEYTQKALQDSLSFVQQQADTELGYQKQLAQRNYLLFGGLAIALLGGLGFYFFQQRRLREKEIAHQKEMLKSTILTQENERQRIAQDLHDSVGSKLNVMNLFLHQLSKRNAEGQEEITDMIGVIDDTLQTTRRISHDLLPPTLDKFGLATAIEEMQEPLLQTGGPELKFEVEGERPDSISSLIELNLFRIIQELLSNSLKYADAQSIEMRLIHSPDKIIAHYRDDGKGFDPKSIKAQKGLGMQNIQSRLQMIEGQMDLQSSPGQGVVVQVEVEV